jgi:hypothetical protein
MDSFVGQPAGGTILLFVIIAVIALLAAGRKWSRQAAVPMAPQAPQPGTSQGIASPQVAASQLESPPITVTLSTEEIPFLDEFGKDWDLSRTEAAEMLLDGAIEEQRRASEGMRARPDMEDAAYEGLTLDGVLGSDAQPEPSEPHGEAEPTLDELLGPSEPHGEAEPTLDELLGAEPIREGRRRRRARRKRRPQ